AISVLSSSQIEPSNYDFNNLFTPLGTDMLCVFGGGQYPDINQCDDDEDYSVLLLTSTTRVESIAIEADKGESEGRGEQHGYKPNKLPPTAVTPLDDGSNNIGLSFEEQLENGQIQCLQAHMVLQLFQPLLVIPQMAFLLCYHCLLLALRSGLSTTSTSRVNRYTSQHCVIFSSTSILL
ncbi:hypothetical protein PAXRUDRAFT_157326, partial [Paxillus rubicundulus Ve08.2h10]